MDVVLITLGEPMCQKATI